mgnify:FL=1
MNWKKKFMWAASFLVSLFVCGTALAAGNDASADTPAQGKEENQVYRFGTENNANDITETEASAAESGAAGFENKEMYLYEGEWVGDGEDWQYRLTDGSFLKASWLKSNGHWYYLGKSSYMQRGLRKIGTNRYYFAESGAMMTGWIYEEETDQWYHANEDGALTTGWYQAGNAWYWFDSKCVMFSGGNRMVNGHKYYFFDNGQMAADQYVELNYYDANGLRDRTHDVRLMGKRRPSDSEKEQITKELAGVPREWMKRFAESGWELMYYTDKAYFSAPKTEQGIYFVNYDTDVHYKKIKFSKPQGLAMAFGEFAASELSDEETSRALTDFERYLAGSGLVQPLPSYFDDKLEMQFGSFFAACCDEDVQADIRKNSPELYKYVVKLGFWQEGQKPDEAEGVEMNSDPEFAGNGAGPAGDESLKAKSGPASEVP